MGSSSRLSLSRGVGCWHRRGDGGGGSGAKWIAAWVILVEVEGSGCSEAQLHSKDGIKRTAFLGHTLAVHVKKATWPRKLPLVKGSLLAQFTDSSR